MGSIHQRIDSANVLHSSQFVWTDAKYLGDLLWRLPGFYLRDLGEAGKPNQYTAFGLDWGSIPILLDGRPLNNPLTGAVNLYDIPIESIEQVEILDGADALMYGGQGAALNLVTRQYNNNRPVTKLRYMQGPFEYGLTDGLFTQNVARGTNVMVGLQRHVSDGRFTNSAYDSWHVRSRVRYNYSDRLNIALSHFYSSATNGMNGGIDTTSPSQFDEVSALVQSPNANDDVSRHDVTLNGIARLFRDTSSTTQFSFYFSEIDRSYNNPDSISQRTTSSLMGARLLQNNTLGGITTTVGADIQRERLQGNRFMSSEGEYRAALFGKTEFDLFDFLKPAASLRIEQRGSRSVFSYGLGMKSTLAEFLMIRGDYSFSQKLTSIQDRLTQPLNPLLPDVGEYKTFRLRLDVSFGSSANISLMGYHQTALQTFWYTEIRPPVFTISFPQIETDQIIGSLFFKPWKLECVWTGMYTMSQHDGIEKTLFPKWTTTGEFAYRDKILKDVMELRTGVRMQYASSHHGIEFYPQYGVYVENTGKEIEPAFTLDLFAIAKLGDAYLTLSWENLLDKQYVTVSGYPMPGRTFRFGFNWTFLD